MTLQSFLALCICVFNTAVKKRKRKASLCDDVKVSRVMSNSAAEEERPIHKNAPSVASKYSAITAGVDVSLLLFPALIIYPK